jgi:hypothetical protein
MNTVKEGDMIAAFEMADRLYVLHPVALVISLSATHMWTALCKVKRTKVLIHMK